MPRNQDGTTERVCLKRKTMEPVGRTKFMRSFIKHEDKINEVLLELLTETSEEKDICDEEDKDLLNEPEDDNEIYEMKEINICNIAMVEPKGVENMGWTTKILTEITRTKNKELHLLELRTLRKNQNQNWKRD